jgi:hypothetical protein
MACDRRTTDAGRLPALFGALAMSYSCPDLDDDITGAFLHHKLVAPRSVHTEDVARRAAALCGALDRAMRLRADLADDLRALLDLIGDPEADPDDAIDLARLDTLCTNARATLARLA